MAQESPTRLSPNKLLLTKWTAVMPRNKEKHFIVTKVIDPEVPGAAIERVELEAVHSGHSRIVRWRSLTDATQWRQGWK